MLKEPYLDRGMRGWIKNTAVANFWRVADWYELEDLIQDGYMIYMRCRRHPNYRGLTELNHPRKGHRRAFMALVQRAFLNHIHTLSAKATASRDVAGVDLNEDEIDGHMQLPEEATAAILVETIPAELSALIDLLANEGIEAVRFLRTKSVGLSRKGRKFLRETTNQHYCRRLGLDPTKINLFEMARVHLGLV